MRHTNELLERLDAKIAELSRDVARTDERAKLWLESRAQVGEPSVQEDDVDRRVELRALRDAIARMDRSGG